MLALLFSPSFLPPTPRYEAIGRRDVLAAAGLAATVLPAPAFAQRSKRVPKSSKESTESYKQFQLSAPKGETEAFKLAEARRKSFESGGSKGPESAAEARLFRQPLRWLKRNVELGWKMGGFVASVVLDIQQGVEPQRRCVERV